MKMAQTDSSVNDPTWSLPADDWDSADGGFALSKKKSQGNPNSSPNTATREAASWLTINPNANDSARINARGRSRGHATPVTEWPDDSRDIETESKVKTRTKTRTTTPDLPTPHHRLKNTPDTEGSTPHGTEIPTNYIKTIENAFGVGADLYSDVLKVSRDSSPRDIRISYFRRGREVLSEGDISHASEAQTVGGSVSTCNKQRFQAVSMAYEIIGNPIWKQEYEAKISDEDDRLVQALAISAPSSPVLRRSSSLGRPRRSRSNRSQGVRWNEQVEELVFDRHPTEVPKSKRGSKRGKRKPKKRVVVDSGELRRHLENLDQQAERHFVADFLDDFEASIDELMSLGSSKGETPKQGKKTKSKPTTPKSKPTPRSGTARSETDGEGLPVKRLSYDFQMPPDGLAADESDDVDYRRSDDTISTLSASVVERGSATKQTEDEHDKDEMANHLESVIEEDQESGSRKIQVYADTSLISEEFANDFDVGCDPDVWCGTEEDAYPTNTKDLSDGNSKEKNPDAAGFHLFLMTYLQSLADDLYTWGASFQDVEVKSTATQLMEAIMISEEDLEGMMGILRTEIDRGSSPVDFD